MNFFNLKYYSKKGEYDVIDVDLYDVTKESITKMHDLGLKVICYFSAGTYEPFRAESQGMKNVDGLIRTKMDEWDEYWLDFRIEDVKPFMTDSLDLAKNKGCDGIEFDNIDAFTAVNWKDKLTAADQLKYNRWLAEEAHARGLAAGLKNCIELLDDLKDVYDFAINEQCSDYNECKEYDVFLNNNLAVFVALYGLTSDTKFINNICNQGSNPNLSIIIKAPDQELEYAYERFDYEKYCEDVHSAEQTIVFYYDDSTTTKKTTTTTKKTTTTAKPTTTTTTSKKTTTTVKPTTTTTKKTTTTVKPTTTTTVKPTTTTTKKTTTTVKPTTTTTKKTTTIKPTTTTTKKTTTTVKPTTTTTKKTTTTVKPTTTTRKNIKKTTTTKKTTKETTTTIKKSTIRKTTFKRTKKTTTTKRIKKTTTKKRWRSIYYKNRKQYYKYY